MDSTIRERWLAKLVDLKVDVAKGNPAPHKPLLLLVIMERTEQGLLQNVLHLSPELNFEFCAYWHIVAYRRTQPPDIRLPFYHLGSSGCWKPMDTEGRLRKAFALPPPSISTPSSRRVSTTRPFEAKRVRVLITRYFPKDEWPGLCAILGIPVPSEEEVVAASVHQSPEEANQKGRETRFRIQVVSNYHYACALTGYRFMTISSACIVDAAHIHQFADSRNNDVRNGLALCKNAHWLFDNGLWTIADDFSIIVARDHFTEVSPDQKPLAGYHGQQIRLPSDPALHPDRAHLAWHRKHKFLGGG